MDGGSTDPEQVNAPPPTIRRTVRTATVLVAVAAVGVLAAACQTGVTMWSACSPARDGNPTGTDGTYVLACRGGRWEPLMTVDEYVRLRQGRKLRIAPLPTAPTTTAPAPPSTTSTTSTTVAPAVATVDVDYQTASAGTYEVNYCDEYDPDNTRTVAQTFVAGRTGELTEVDLSVQPIGAPDPISVSIRTLDGGAPGSTVLGAGTYSGPGASGDALVEIPLVTAAPVTAGTSYAIVIDPAPCSEDAWRARAASPGLYAGGNVFNGPNGGGWSPEPVDLLFRTWIR